MVAVYCCGPMNRVNGVNRRGVFDKQHVTIDVVARTMVGNQVVTETIGLLL